jgi:hypothetical protein
MASFQSAMDSNRVVYARQGQCAVDHGAGPVVRVFTGDAKSADRSAHLSPNGRRQHQTVPDQCRQLIV